MTVDLRAIVATSLGLCESGDVGSNLISDRSGVVMTQGRLQMSGIVTPARGTAIQILVACPQTGKVTRFPKPLFVVRAVADVIERTSEIEVGCRLTLMKDRKDQDVYRSTLYTPPGNNFVTPPGGIPVVAPIYAQQCLLYCLGKVGLQLASTSRPLVFRFMRPEIDLSVGYVRIIGDLIRSECCFGRILPDGKFQVVPLGFQTGGLGPVLTQQNLVSIEPITVGSEPPDGYVVSYNAAERKR